MARIQAYGLEGYVIKIRGLVRQLQNIVHLHKNPNNLIFAVYQKKTNPIPDYLYGDFRAAFAKTLDRIGKDSFEDNKRRRKITLHSFRRFVKSTISDLGYADFSEYFIGHSGKHLLTERQTRKRLKYSEKLNRILLS